MELGIIGVDACGLGIRRGKGGGGGGEAAEPALPGACRRENDDVHGDGSRANSNILLDT